MPTSVPAGRLRYVYAVCRPLDAPPPAGRTGVAGAPPRQLEHHGLVAVVADAPERDFTEAPLRAHLEDLDWLTATATATARAHQTVAERTAREDAWQRALISSVNEQVASPWPELM
ncbi:GvpL/GvpF family gas vesicle protein [Streptomyces sp. HUAS MG91]|uniref:GvpL/GvpF family gas vesicle protein n=1 Tax=Streptomyces tabacisoli TaxID=3156398 RepID=A0AAU8J0I4_9ACTN